MRWIGRAMSLWGLSIIITLFSVLCITSHLIQLFELRGDFSLETQIQNVNYRLDLQDGLSFRVLILDPKETQASEARASEEKREEREVISSEVVHLPDEAHSSEKRPSSLSSPRQLARELLLESWSTGEPLLKVLQRSRDTLFQRLFEHYWQQMNRQVEERSSWLQSLHHQLRYLSLLAILSLLIPLMIYRRSGDTRRALKLIPYSVAACACLMLISTSLLNQLYQLQVFQIFLGVLSLPHNSLYLDGLLILKYAPLQSLVEHLPQLIMPEISWESSAGYSDPWGTTAALIVQLHDSSVARAVQQLARLSAEVTTLYGPLLAGASFYLIYLVFRPVSGELLKYPRSLIESDATPSFGSLFRYLKLVLKVVWSEARALLITIVSALLLFAVLFALQLSASAVTGASLSSIVIWSGELASLSAVIPEYSSVGSVGAVALFLFLFNTSIALILALAIRCVYLVSRDKFTHKEPYRSYVILPKLSRFLIRQALPRLTLQLITLTLVSALVMYLKVSPTHSISLMMGVYILSICVLWWRLPPTQNLLTLYRSDLLQRDLLPWSRSALSDTPPK